VVSETARISPRATDGAGGSGEPSASATEQQFVNEVTAPRRADRHIRRKRSITTEPRPPRAGSLPVDRAAPPEPPVVQDPRGSGRGARSAFAMECVALNRRLVSASTTEDILDLVILHGESFTYVNAVTAFYRLARLCDRMPSHQVAATKQDPRMSLLCDLVDESLPRCDSQALSNACYAHALLGHGSPTLVSGLVAAVGARISGFDQPKELGIAVWSVARMSVRGEVSGDDTRAFFEAVWPAVEAKAAHLDAQATFNLLWAFAAVRLADARVLGVLCGAARARAGSMSFREIAGVLLTLSKVKHYDEATFAELCAAAGRILARVRDGSLPLRRHPRDADYANAATAVAHFVQHRGGGGLEQGLASGVDGRGSPGGRGGPPAGRGGDRSIFGRLAKTERAPARVDEEDDLVDLPMSSGDDIQIAWGLASTTVPASVGVLLGDISLALCGHFPRAEGGARPRSPVGGRRGRGGGRPPSRAQRAASPVPGVELPPAGGRGPGMAGPSGRPAGAGAGKPTAENPLGLIGGRIEDPLGGGDDGEPVAGAPAAVGAPARGDGRPPAARAASPVGRDARGRGAGGAGAPGRGRGRGGRRQDLILDRMRPRYLSNVLWAMASTGTYDEELFRRAGYALQRRLRTGARYQFPPQTLATLLWAYARAGYFDARLTAALCEASAASLAEVGFSAAPRTPGMGHSPANKLTSSSLYMAPDAQPFSQKSVAMIAYAVSTLAPEEPSSRALVSDMVRAVAPAFGQLGSQLTCNLLWSAVVCQAYPRELSRLKQRAADLADSLNRTELWQMYQVDVALRAEARAVETSTPGNVSGMLSTLLSAGRLKDRAHESWAQGRRFEIRSVSKFHLEVLRAVRELGYPGEAVELEHLAEYTVDIAFPAHRVALEVDGPAHFFRNAPVTQGRYVLKRRVLERLGWTVVSVPYLEWKAGTPWEDRVAYLRRTLADAGLPSPAALAASGGSGPAAGAGAGGQEGAAAVGEQPGPGEVSREGPPSRSEMVERAARLAGTRGTGKGSLLLKTAVRRRAAGGEGE